MAADSLSVNVCFVSPGQMLIVCLCQTTSHCAAPFTKNDMWYRWKIWGICKLWCTDWIEFYCFPHCLFLFFTEWKTPVSFCEQVQQYIKGEQITHKWDNLNEWPSSTTDWGEGIKTGGGVWGGLWRGAEINRADRHEWSESSWWITCLSPIRGAFLINLHRNDVSLHLNSSSQRGSLSEFCFLLSLLSIAPSGIPASKLASGFPSLVSWAS